MEKLQNTKVSMQSIADAVGGARSTISFVLNGKEKEGCIKEEMYRYFNIFNTSRIHINNYEISKMAVQLLIGKGCKKIALVSYHETLMHIQKKKRGYIDALSANNYYAEDLICEGNYSDPKNRILMLLPLYLFLVLNNHGIISILSVRIYLLHY